MCLRSCFTHLWELNIQSFIHFTCFVISHFVNISHFKHYLMFLFTSYHKQSCMGYPWVYLLANMWHLFRKQFQNFGESGFEREKTLKFVFINLGMKLSICSDYEGSHGFQEHAQCVPPKAMGIQFQITLQLLKVSQNIVYKHQHFQITAIMRMLLDSILMGQERTHILQYQRLFLKHLQLFSV